MVGDEVSLSSLSLGSLGRVYPPSRWRLQSVILDTGFVTRMEVGARDAGEQAMMHTQHLRHGRQGTHQREVNVLIDVEAVYGVQASWGRCRCRSAFFFFVHHAVNKIVTVRAILT